MLTLGSLFDGIGGWLDAAVRAGVKPIWASEIEPFPCAVTAHHYPDVKQLGDITKIDVDELEPVDIVCAGSPCQDLSVAGKREGLAGERSGLFRTAVELVHRLRDRTGLPRFFVWENVPGAFSSNKGMDFRAVLEEIGQTKIPMPTNGKWATAGMAELPQCEIAWRVMDAQYWGVPQRRKRIFLVADFAESGRCAAEVLFVESGLSGHTAESGEAGEETSTRAGAGTDTAGHGLMPTRGGISAKARGIGYQNEQAPTLDTNGNYAVAYSISHDIRSARLTANITDPLTSTDYKEPPAVTVRMRSGCEGGGKGPLVSEEKSLTLATNNDQTVFQKAIAITGETFFDVGENICPTLKRRDYKEPIAVCASSFGGYSKSDVAGNIRSSGGDIGGGSEALILE